MTAADFAPIFQALIAGVAMLLTGLIAVYVPKAIAAFEARTHIALTQQQREAIRGAAMTQAGLIETALQQGVLKLSQIRPDTPEMLAQARAALARVPESAAAVGTTPAAMSAIIVGNADTRPVVLAVPKGVPA